MRVEDKVLANPEVFRRKYAISSDESWAACVARVVNAVVSHWPKDKRDYLFDMIYNLRFLPGGRILANAGIEEGTMMNCYILDVDDSLDSIFESFNLAGKILSMGGGVGLNWSKLRENGAPVGKREGLASGPISFIKMFDAMAETIRQGRNRRGACMAILNSDHPDVFDFIDLKAKEGVLTCHNISVMLKDGVIRSRYSGEVLKEVSEKSLLTRIAEAAWRNGEPGVMFFDNINKVLPRDVLERFGPIEGSNPCLAPWTLLFDGDRWTPITAREGKTFRSWPTGVKRVFRIWFSNGQHVDCTADHLLWLKTGDTLGEREAFWVPAIYSLGMKAGFWPYNRYYSRKPNILSKPMLVGLLFMRGFAKWYGSEHITLTNVQRYKELIPFFKSLGGVIKKSPLKKGKLIVRFSRFALEKLLTEREKRLLFDQDGRYGKELPDWLMTEHVDYIASFLRGMYAMSGVVCSGGVRQGNWLKLQFFQPCEKLVRQIQQLLQTFGIQSTVKRITDGRLGLFIMSPRSLTRFMQFIGLPVPEKEERLKEELVELRRTEPVKTTATVIDIEDLGMHEVWDFRMKIPGPFAMASGVLVHNCSEILSWPYTACCLGSMNLFEYWNGHEFEFEKFERDVAIATEFLDAVLDAERYPDERIARFSRDTARQIGLGVLGFHDLLIAMGIPYDSDEALEWIDKIGSVIKRVTTETSIKLGGGKPKNVMRTCIAPTGSLQLLAGVSSGIEPHFSLHTVKKTSLGEIKLMPAIALRADDPEKVLEWLKGKPFAKTALEISPEWHVRVLAQWTKWIDSGISKTINMPNSATVEDVYNVLVMAKELGVKSLTVYRDGSREEQVLYTQESRKKQVRIERPPILNGRTYRRKLGCEATAYVTINYSNGKPIECFINIGKSGGCIRAFAEALGRLISIYLQDVGDVERLVKQLQGIVCSYSALQFKSCPDLIAELLKLDLDNAPIKQTEGAMVCPNCNSSLIPREGCWVCPFCGYSRCDG